MADDEHEKDLEVGDDESEEVAGGKLPPPPSAGQVGGTVGPK